MPEQGVLKKVFSFFSFDSERDEMEELGVEEKEKPNDKVVPITKKTRHAEISIYTPENYEDALVVADCLKGSQAVVLNLSRMEIGTATRILDFVSGIIHAIDGSFKKVGENIFVFTPASIDITPESELKPAAKDGESLFFSER